jgi:hypothetical protein
MPKKKKKKKPVAKKAKKKQVSPQVALNKANNALVTARQQWAKALFALKAGGGGGGCFGKCDGYGFGVGFDWERGECPTASPCRAHNFTPAAQAQAEKDLMAQANASCGRNCACVGGTVREHRRDCETVRISSGENEGTWCMYTLVVELQGGTCQAVEA